MAPNIKASKGKEKNVKKQVMPVLEEFFFRSGCAALKTLPVNQSFIMSPYLSHFAMFACYHKVALKTLAKKCDKKEADGIVDIFKPFDFVKDIVAKEKRQENLEVMSQIYVANTFQIRESFEKFLLRGFPFAEIKSMNLLKSKVIADEVNSQLVKKIGTKLKDLVEQHEINASNQIYVFNAIRVKAAWARSFDGIYTCRRPFYTCEDMPVQVAMMRRWSWEKYGNVPALDATVLELNFHESEMRMMFFLPNNKKKEDMDQLISKLQTVKLPDIVSCYNIVKTNVQIPKFKIEHTTNESEVCNIYEKAYDALKNEFPKSKSDDFGGKRTWIAECYHKAYIEINEFGTQSIDTCEHPECSQKDREFSPGEVEFTADHPFVFIIRLHSIVLVQGIVDEKAVVPYISPKLKEKLKELKEKKNELKERIPF